MSHDIVDERDAQAPGHGSRNLTRLVEAAQPFAPPVQGHGQHGIDVVRQVLACPKQQLRERRRVVKAPAELQRLDRRVDRERIGERRDLALERRTAGPGRQPGPGQVLETVAADRALETAGTRAAECTPQGHDGIVESTQQ